MKPIKGYFGSASQCCCSLSLTTANIIIALIFTVNAITSLTLSSGIFMILGFTCYLISLVCIIISILRKNSNLMIIACAVYIGLIIISTIEVIIVLTVPQILYQKLEYTKLTYTISYILFICLSLWFLRIMLSLANIYAVNGTGWEKKNWIEIQEEKEDTEKKDNEEKETPHNINVEPNDKA